jgi:hypothetical protein
VAQTAPHQSTQRSLHGGGLGQTELPQGGQFEPRIEAALQYVSNINLAEDGEDEIGMFGLEAAPGFYSSYSTDSVLAAIDYSLIGRAWEDSDYDDVTHSLNANGRWYAIPEWISLSGQAGYDDAIIDPGQGINYGDLGVFGPSNLSEIATAGVTPALSHRFGDIRVDAHYSYGRTWYLDEGKGQPVAGRVSNQDSEDQAAGASVGTSEDAGSKLSGRAFYDWQKSEYETALPYQYERAGIDAGLQIARTFTLVGEYGLESDLADNTTEGGLDSEYWTAGLRWEPNERTSAEGRYGERFFGDSWSLDITHRARLLEFNAAYSEEPSVETRQYSLGAFDPGTLPPDFPAVDFGILTSAPYVARNASARIAANGAMTTLSITGFHYDRDYLTAQRQDETNFGVSIGATRQLGSNLSADFTVSHSKYERGLFLSDGDLDSPSSDDDTTVVLRLNRESGQRLTLSGEAGYLTRSGDQEYDGWWLALRGRWMP